MEKKGQISADFPQAALIALLTGYGHEMDVSFFGVGIDAVLPAAFTRGSGFPSGNIRRHGVVRSPLSAHRSHVPFVPADSDGIEIYPSDHRQYVQLRAAYRGLRDSRLDRAGYLFLAKIDGRRAGIRRGLVGYKE